MYVWIFQSGEPLHSDKDNYRPMRCMNLANTLVKRGHSVLLLSSSFFHQKKFHRSKNYKEIKINKSLKILLIPSPGYKKNLSISRLFDHLVLAFNLARILKLQTKFPDVAFIGYPPIETAYVLVKWLKKKKNSKSTRCQRSMASNIYRYGTKIVKTFCIYIFFSVFFGIEKNYASINWYQLYF